MRRILGWIRTPDATMFGRWLRRAAVQQIVSRAVIWTEIVHILEAAGLDTPHISILSDELLA